MSLTTLSELWKGFLKLAGMADIFHFALLAIFSVILGEMIAMLLSRVYRIMYGRTRQKLRLSLLKAEVEKAIAPVSPPRKGVHAWQGYRKFRVLQKTNECRDVCSIYLVSHDGKPISSFRPGQFLTLRHRVMELNPGGRKELVRCYSISSGPGAQDWYRISVRKASPPGGSADLPPGLMSNILHHEIGEGDILDVMAPSGNFFLDTSRDGPIVLVSNGIGVTPLLSMLEATVQSGSKREVRLFLGFRCEREHPFREHIQKIVAENDNIYLHVSYSSPGPGDLPGRDYHHRGRVGIDLLKRQLPSNGYEFYLCGSQEMVASVTDGLRTWGVPEVDIHSESFGPGPSLRSWVGRSPEEGAKKECPLKFKRGKMGMTSFKSLGAVRWSLVWTKVDGEPDRAGSNGTAPAGEKFMGWLLVNPQSGWRAVAAFNAAGKFLSGSISPSNRMTSPLKQLFSELAGREAEDVAHRLAHHLERERSKAEALDVRVWLDLVRAFPAVKEESTPFREAIDSVLNEGAEAEKKVTVTFSKSKKTLEWDSSSASLLDFAHRNGVSIEASCRSGNCGACMTALKKGGVVYLRAPGREPGDGSCLTCIAVPRENLTLQA